MDDYVSIPNTVGNFGTNDNFTVSCWIKPDINQSSPNGQFYNHENDIITRRFDVNASVRNPYPFEITYLNNNRSTVSERNKIRVSQWDGTNFPSITSTTPLNDGKWHHVAFVREPDNFKLYIDGVQEGGTVADNTTDATTNTTELQIGRRANNQNFFKGEIDEVQLWNIPKTQAEIQNERFCKTQPHPNLLAFYNSGNGVPHGNNVFITQYTSNGTLHNFALTGDTSNFVTGQVKYVNSNSVLGSNNGSSWANAFTNLQDALTTNACNDLFDIYVAKGIYKPSTSGNINASYNISSGMKIYGGFSSNEKSINQRNLALIHSTNKTTLSGDLGDNDTPFNFSSNRVDNSLNVVNIQPNNDNVFDGFMVRGASSIGLNVQNTNVSIKYSKFIDNHLGLNIFNTNTTISNCSIMGNSGDGINISGSAANDITANIKESLIATNGANGISINTPNYKVQTTIIINSTIASNASNGIFVISNTGGFSANSIGNTIINGNNLTGIASNNVGGTIQNYISYSLVQGNAGGTNGNLNGNNTNPQFVNPLANTVRSDGGDYRLKDPSPCINACINGVSPFDLDRNLRPQGGEFDMGAYESNINMNEIISKATGNWETTTTWNLERLPLPTDKVILNGHQVTITTNAARAKDLEYKTGAILRYLAGGLLRFGI